MASSEKTITKEDVNDKTPLEEFKAGVVKSMKQYNEGLVETFDNVEDFLKDLNSPD